MGEFGSSFASEFKFGFKECTAQGDSGEPVTIIEDFCASTLFKGMIKHDDDVTYDNNGEFNFPEAGTVTFECTITVCHEATASTDCWETTATGPLDLASDNCVNGDDQLWTDPASSRRRRGNGEISADGQDCTLKATIDLNPKSAESNAATVMVTAALLLLTVL